MRACVRVSHTSLLLRLSLSLRPSNPLSRHAGRYLIPPVIFFQPIVLSLFPSDALLKLRECDHYLTALDYCCSVTRFGGLIESPDKARLTRSMPCHRCAKLRDLAPLDVYRVCTVAGAVVLGLNYGCSTVWKVCHHAANAEQISHMSLHRRFLNHGMRSQTGLPRFPRFCMEASSYRRGVLHPLQPF